MRKVCPRARTESHFQVRQNDSIVKEPEPFDSARTDIVEARAPHLLGGVAHLREFSRNTPSQNPRRRLKKQKIFFEDTDFRPPGVARMNAHSRNTRVSTKSLCQ